MTDQETADAIRRGVAHNQHHGNVRGQFHTIGGRHCIDGSFRALGVPRRVRERIGAATMRHAGQADPLTGVPYDHVGVNDTARRPAQMHAAMLAVADKLAPARAQRPQRPAPAPRSSSAARPAVTAPRRPVLALGAATATVGVLALAAVPAVGAALGAAWAVASTVLAVVLFAALGVMVAAPVLVLAWEADPRRSIPAWAARTAALGRARREARERASAAVAAARAPIALGPPEWEASDGS